MSYIDRLAADFASDIKDGSGAQRCRWRFKHLVDAREDEAGRNMFALMVATWCSVTLGRDFPPALKFYRPAKEHEEATYGSDDWNGRGFMEPATGDIWLRDDMKNWELVEVVAHETLHAIKHRGRGVSAEMEREALDFGWRVAALWNLPPEPLAELYVAQKWSELPRLCHPFSSAVVMEDLSLCRAVHHGRHVDARWRTAVDLKAELPDSYERCFGRKVWFTGR